MSESLPKRKRPAHPLPVRRHNQPIILFVTVCSKERKRIFDNDEFQSALIDIWHNSNKFAVGYYLIMPDHIHFFCSPGTGEINSVVKWVGYWKRQVSIKCSELKSKWLRNCWDTQMRSQEMYLKKLEYVRENPVRATLVKRSNLWPYQGSLNDLAWIL